MIARKGTIVRDAITKLIPELWGKPRIATWMYGLLVEVQDLEDTVWRVLESRLIDTATGRELRILGQIVGQPNLGPWTDDVYRLFIKGRVRANRSNGRIKDILDVASVVCDAVVGWNWTGGATFEITVETAYPSAVLAILLDTAAAGVDLRVHYAASDPDSWMFDVEDRGPSDLAEAFGGKLTATATP